MSDIKSISERYMEEFSSSYYDDQILIDKILNTHPKCETIADIACGPGRLTELFLKRASKVYCFDNDVGMLNQLVVRFPQLKETAVKYNMNASILPCRFDFIGLCGNSIGHLGGYQELRSFFKHVKSHLNPNGIFYQKSPEDHVHSLKNLDVMVNGDIIENHSGALCD